MLDMSRLPGTSMRNPSGRAAYVLLAKTIFILWPAVLPEWTVDNADEARRTDVFRHAFELCDTMQQRLGLHIDLRGAATLAMLACTTTSLVRDAYGNMLKRSRAILRAAQKVMDPATGSILATCTTMENQAPRLRLMLQFFQHLDGLHQIMAGCGDLLMDLQCLQNEAQHIVGLLNENGS